MDSAGGGLETNSIHYGWGECVEAVLNELISLSSTTVLVQFADGSKAFEKMLEARLIFNIKEMN